KTFVPGLGRGIMYKPWQKPRPEIVGTVVAPRSKGVIAMGERDFHPLSANFLLPHWLPSHWENYAEGKRRAGKSPDPAEWRIARTIFVSDDDRVAERYARGRDWQDPRARSARRPGRRRTRTAHAQYAAPGTGPIPPRRAVRART